MSHIILTPNIGLKKFGEGSIEYGTEHLDPDSRVSVINYNLDKIDSALTAIGGGAVLSFAENEVPAGTIDGSNPGFTLANTPVAGSLKLYKNGLRLQLGNDFSLSGNTITYLSGQVPQVGDTHLADYRY